MVNIIHKRSFVIETRLPIKFGNKKVMDDNQGEIIVPDISVPTEYQWQWFCGVGANPKLFYERGVIIPMNVWSPYPFQAAKYDTKDEALAVHEQILGGDPACFVVDWEQSHHKEGLQILVPVTAAEAAALTGMPLKHKPK